MLKEEEEFEDEGGGEVNVLRRFETDACEVGERGRALLVLLLLDGEGYELGEEGVELKRLEEGNVPE